MAREVGVYASLEGAATWAALKTLRRNTFLAGNEDVVLFNTGMGLKNEAPAIAK
jgi:threonine synthase